MRWGLVVLLLYAAACESRYGAYLVIQGNADFDEVELYFGKEVSSSGPGSASTFASPTFGPELGLVFDRKFDRHDVFGLEAASNGTTYWIPPSEVNDKLGAYVVAVALRGGQPVGIGEYFSFSVPPDAVHEYQVTLEPYAQQAVERWGAAPGCIVWKRARSGRHATVAVVREHDRDCDELDVVTDCNDLCSAQSPACALDRTLCNASGACALGCSASGLCAPKVCLPPLTCSQECATKLAFDEKMKCAYERHQDHIFIAADLTSTGGESQLCARSFVFSPGIPCNEPAFEWIDPELQTRFMPKISPTDDDPPSCVLDLATTGPFSSGEDLHMVISFAPHNGIGPRPSLIMGLTTSGLQQCRAVPYELVRPTPDFLYECP